MRYPLHWTLARLEILWVVLCFPRTRCFRPVMQLWKNRHGCINRLKIEQSYWIGREYHTIILTDTIILRFSHLWSRKRNAVVRKYLSISVSFTNARHTAVNMSKYLCQTVKITRLKMKANPSKLDRSLSWTWTTSWSLKPSCWQPCIKQISLFFEKKVWNRQSDVL